MSYETMRQHKKRKKLEAKAIDEINKKNGSESLLESRTGLILSFEKLKEAGFPNTTALELQLVTKNRLRAIGNIIIGNEVDTSSITRLGGRRISIVKAVKYGYVIPDIIHSTSGDSRMWYDHSDPAAITTEGLVYPVIGGEPDRSCVLVSNRSIGSIYRARQLGQYDHQNEAIYRRLDEGLAEIATHGN